MVGGGDLWHGSTLADRRARAQLDICRHRSSLRTFDLFELVTDSLHLYEADASETVAKRLRDASADADMKLDMGEGCVRFGQFDQLAVDALIEAITSVSVDSHIELYEASCLG